MQLIKPTPNKHPSVKCRKRDIVVRLADWTRDRDEPAYDVEVYIGWVYDWNESETFSTKNHTPPRNKAQARIAATAFASAQIAKLL